MTQREKLVEILSKKICTHVDILDGSVDGVSYKEILADFLIENGVTVPECKIGDTVYMVISMEHTKHRPFIHEEKVEFVGVTTENVFGGLCPLPSEKFGKEYFLNEAEAEAALGKLLEEYDGKN